MKIICRAILAFWLLGAGAALAGEKWALLIGIGDYLDGSDIDLKGPPNDIRMMDELLQAKFGYQPDHIWKLVDAEATKAKIM
jgi:hypothetical protein